MREWPSRSLAVSQVVDERRMKPKQRVGKPGLAAAEIERGHGLARVQFVSAIQLVVVVSHCCSGRDRGIHLSDWTPHRTAL